MLFLDADERITEELGREIGEIILKTDCHGFYIKRNFFFLGRWLKRGGYQSDYILRLVRKEYVQVTPKGAREYFIVDGSLGYLKNTMIHEDKNGLFSWIEKQNKKAVIEANVLYNQKFIKDNNQNKETNNDNLHVEKKMRIWLREKIWVRLPLLIRPFIYFFYCYF